MPIRIDGDNATATPGITGGDADTGLVFGTDEIEAVTGGTTRFTVESNGNCTIENGNLVLASGSGIDFSATADGSGTTSSELLDDYEEGTWTPTYEPHNNSFSSITYDAVVYGYYQKVGEVVHITGFIRTDSLTVGTASGNLYLGGLPYSPHVGPGENQSIYVSNSGAWAGDHPTFGLNSGSGDRFALYYKTAINSDNSVVQVSDMNTGADDNQIYFTGWFRAT